MAERNNLNFTGILSEERILFLDSVNKNEALDTLINCLAESAEVSDKEELRSGIFHRESLMSTGIGLGIGVPHVRLKSIKKPVMAFGICKQPLSDYESIDGEAVSLIFMIAAGEGQHTEHIKLLSEISNVCKNPAFREKLLSMNSGKEVFLFLMEAKS